MMMKLKGTQGAVINKGPAATISTTTTTRRRPSNVQNDDQLRPSSTVLYRTYMLDMHFQLIANMVDENEANSSFAARRAAPMAKTHQRLAKDEVLLQHFTRFFNRSKFLYFSYYLQCYDQLDSLEKKKNESQQGSILPPGRLPWSGAGDDENCDKNKLFQKVFSMFWMEFLQELIASLGLTTKNFASKLGFAKTHDSRHQQTDGSSSLQEVLLNHEDMIIWQDDAKYLVRAFFKISSGLHVKSFTAPYNYFVKESMTEIGSSDRVDTIKSDVTENTYQKLFKLRLQTIISSTTGEERNDVSCGDEKGQRKVSLLKKNSTGESFDRSELLAKKHVFHPDTDSLVGTVGSTFLLLYTSPSCDKINLENDRGSSMENISLDDDLISKILNSRLFLNSKDVLPDHCQKFFGSFTLERKNLHSPSLEWCRYFQLPINCSEDTPRLQDRFLIPLSTATVTDNGKRGLLEVYIKYPAHPVKRNVISVGVVRSSSSFDVRNPQQFYLRLFAEFCSRNKALLMNTYHFKFPLQPGRLIAFPHTSVGFKLNASLSENLKCLQENMHDHLYCKDYGATQQQRLTETYCTHLREQFPKVMTLSMKLNEHQLSLPLIVAMVNYKNKDGIDTSALTLIESRHDDLHIDHADHIEEDKKDFLSKKLNVIVENPEFIYGDNDHENRCENRIACFTTSKRHEFIVAATVTGKVLVFSLEANERIFVGPFTTLDKTRTLTNPTAIAVFINTLNDAEHLFAISYFSGDVILCRFSMDGAFEVVSQIEIPLNHHSSDLADYDLIDQLLIYDHHNVVINLESGYLLHWAAHYRHYCWCGKDDHFDDEPQKSIQYLEEFNFHDDSELTSPKSQRQISCMDACRSRSLLAAGSFHRTITMWLVHPDDTVCKETSNKFSSAKKHMELTDHRSGISALTFSTSGSLIYAGGYDGSITVWDIVVGKKLRVLEDASRLPKQLFHYDTNETHQTQRTPQQPEKLHVHDHSSLWFDSPLSGTDARIKFISLSDNSAIVTILFANGQVVFLDSRVESGYNSDEHLRCNMAIVDPMEQSSDYGKNDSLLVTNDGNKSNVCSHPLIESSVTNDNDEVTPAMSKDENDDDVDPRAISLTFETYRLSSAEFHVQQSQDDHTMDNLPMLSGQSNDEENTMPSPTRVTNAISWDMTACTTTDSSNNNNHFPSLETEDNPDIADNPQASSVPPSPSPPSSSERETSSAPPNNSILWTVIETDDNQAWESKIKSIIIQKELCFVGRRHTIQVMDLSRSVIRTFKFQSLLEPEVKCSKSYQYDVKLLSSKRKPNRLICIFAQQIFELTVNPLTKDIWISNWLTTNETFHANTEILAQCIEKTQGDMIGVCRKMENQIYVDIYKETSTASTTDPQQPNYTVAWSWLLPIDAGETSRMTILSLPDGNEHWVIVGTESGAVFAVPIVTTTTSDVIVHNVPHKPIYFHLRAVRGLDVQDHFIMSGGYDYEVKIYDMKQETIIRSIPHQQPITFLTTCPLTGILLTGCKPDMICIWYWQTGDLLGQFRQSNARLSDYVEAIAFSDCEQIYITTADDCKRLQVYRHLTTDTFERIHTLALMKQRGHTENFARLPVNVASVTRSISLKSNDSVLKLCEKNPREVRECLSLITSMEQVYDSTSLATRRKVDFHIPDFFAKLNTKKLKRLLEEQPHLSIMKCSTYGNLLQTMLAYKHIEHHTLRNSSIALLLDVYNYLLGTSSGVLQLNVNEDYWKTAKKSFHPYMNIVDKKIMAQDGFNEFVKPFSDCIEINDIIKLCEGQEQLFIRFVRHLKPVRNYLSMLPMNSKQRRSIPAKQSYVLAGSQRHIERGFWKKVQKQHSDSDGNENDKTANIASDLANPLYIPIRNIAGKNSLFLSSVIRSVDHSDDYSLLCNSVIKLVIDYKWTTYVSTRFNFDFAMLLIWNVLIVLNALLTRDYHAYRQEHHHIVTLVVVLRTIIIIFLCKFLLREVIELVFTCIASVKSINNKKTNSMNKSRLHTAFTVAYGLWHGMIEFCSQVNNWVDAAIGLGLVAALEFQGRVIDSSSSSSVDINQDQQYCNNIFAILMPLLGLNLLHDLSGLEWFGSHISMMIVMVKSSFSVLLILAVMVICFSAAFMLVCTSMNSFHTFNMALVAVYSYMFGGYDFDEMYSATSPTIAVLLLVVFLIIVALILLNLLIAIMGNSQEKLNDLVDEAVLLSKARFIAEYEMLMWFIDWPDWIYKSTSDNEEEEEVKVSSSSNKVTHAASSFKAVFKERESKRWEIHQQTDAEMGSSKQNASSSKIIPIAMPIQSDRTICKLKSIPEELKDMSETHSVKQRQVSWVFHFLNHRGWLCRKLSSFCISILSWCVELKERVSLLAILHWLMFAFTSITIVDDSNESNFFPVYIQILAKEGFTFKED